MSGRIVYEARPARIRSSSGGVPTEVDGIAVEAICEEWLVEDRWWTSKPLGRRYFELVLVGGGNVVVFRDMAGGRWFRQRG